MRKTKIVRIVTSIFPYAKTREECEKLLAEMIAEKKAEIAAEKAKMKTA